MHLSSDFEISISKKKGKRKEEKGKERKNKGGGVKQHW